MSFGFPWEPYGVQVDLATAIRDLLEAHPQKCAGIFESPTGTGKSVTVLCSTLSWLDGQRRGDAAGSEPDWVQEHRRRRSRPELELEPEAGAGADADADADAEPELERRAPKRPSLDADADAKHLLLSSESEPEDDAAARTRVFYCSRTHTQLSQVSREFAKTAWAKVFRSVVVASRKQLCINPRVNGAALQTLNDRCLEMGAEREASARCPFLPRDCSFGRFAHELTQSVCDIEDAVSLGSELSVCPYYGSRAALRQADLVFLPYSALLQPQARRSLGVGLRNSVVVLDEGHNVAPSINDLQSSAVAVSQLLYVGNCIQKYADRFRARLGGPKMLLLLQTAAFLRGVVGYCRALKAPASVDTAELLSGPRLDNLNPWRLLHFVEAGAFSRKLSACFEADEEGRERGVSHFRSFCSFLRSMCLASGTGRVLVERAGGGDTLLRFVSLDAGAAVSDLFGAGAIRTLLVVGGTLTPRDEILDQLLGCVARDRLVEFSCGHVVPDHHKRLLVASELGGAPFRFTQRTRADVQAALGAWIARLLGHVPGGTVVFFPSYASLAELLEAWRGDGTWGAMLRAAPVVAEQQAPQESAFEAYSRHLQRGRCAALFAVVGGRLSEGINFSDRLARCVVVVGVPLANAESQEVQLRMQRSPSPAQYLERAAMRAVNQSIGRALRHARDYAVVILADQRYSPGGPLFGMLPTWMRASYAPAGQGQPVFAAVDDFFRQHEPQPGGP